MISKTVEKNKFGGCTWHFKLDSLHQVFLNESDNGSFVVEFKEWKFISYKTHFSFITQQNLKGAIEESLDRIYEYLKHQNKYDFSIERREHKIIELLNFIDLYNLDVKG